ncbi:MAG: DUF3052 domain-containing protein [Sandaracinus sp.]|nr:DUF3052 domain-containing protein [Sandaracinus sp.]MCB9621433.1 DUF3052 domain-containing protein [Sandaracinus sp.]
MRRLREGLHVVVLGAPRDYETIVPDLPADVRVGTRLARDVPFVHLFVNDRAVLEKQLARTLEKVARDGTIWVSWPKKSAKVPTDVTEDVIREVALPMQLVDVKVCAVDEVWSGLKLMIRREAR